MVAHDLRLALDPIAFARDIGLTPDDWQSKVLNWAGNRLLLNCARQTGKSTISSILALHRALYYAESLILLISPSLRQSSELFRRVSDLLSKLSIKPGLIEDNKLSCTFENGSRIVSLPSTESTIRGFSGASLIVEDEASRVPDELYRAVRPMLATSGGKLILMSTPFGKRGHFWEEWDKGESWGKVQVRADECPRISEQFLREERASLGDWWYRQEYECEFVESVDSVFGYKLVMDALSTEVKPLFAEV